MVRTYKKKSKNKITRGGSNTNKAATKIQTAYRSKKASTLRKKNSVKKIQSSARKAFAFAEDKCPICIETNFVKNNVTTLPCGHKLHKKCLEQLKNSNANTGIPLKCPTCRRHVKEVDDDLDNFIRTIVRRHLIPALASAENMSNLIRLFKNNMNNMSSAPQDEIRNYLTPRIRIINLRWARLNEKLDMINRSIRYSTGEKKGQIKNAIGKPTLESLRKNYLPSVIAYKKYLEDYDIVIPGIIIPQIAEIERYFVEKGFKRPTNEEITRINSVM